MQSDDFPFQPTPGNYRAIISGGQWTDFGCIGGYCSPGVTEHFPPLSEACPGEVFSWTDPSSVPENLPSGYEIPARYITTVGNRLQVKISAAHCRYGYTYAEYVECITTYGIPCWYYDFDEVIGYQGVSITWIAKCDQCGSGACGQPGASQHQNQCVNSTFSLGQTAFGASAGQLKLYSLTPSPQLATPAGLQAFAASGVEVVTNAAGVRQALAPQTLADIVTNNAFEYQINFYAPGNFGTATNANGLYSTNGTPFKIVTIQNPDASTNVNNRLLIIESDTGAQTDYVFTNQQWNLTTGNGLRQESRSVQWQSNMLTEANIVSDGAGKVATKTVYTYQVLPGATNTINTIVRVVLTATNLVQKIVDPDGTNPLTNQWIYNTDTNKPGYGNLQMSIDPYGHWARYEYGSFGQLTNEVSQFLDAPTNAPNSSVRVVWHQEFPYSQSVDRYQKQRVTYVQGQEIGRSYEIDSGYVTQLIRAQVSGAATNDANNLVTTTVTYPDGAFVGRTKSISHPDGTLDLYTYSTNGTAITTEHHFGAAGPGGTNVIDGTRTVTVNDSAGNLVSEATYDIASGKLVASQSAIQSNQFGRATMVVSLEGTNTTMYTCCGVGSITTAEGVTTSYQYDLLKRVTTTTVAGIATTNDFDADGRSIRTVRLGSDNNAIRLNSSVYDLAGRLTYSTNALSFPTSYTETRDGSGHLVRTTTNPDNSMRIETYYQDGQLKSVMGTAVHGMRYEYGVELESGVNRRFTKEIKLTNGCDTGECDSGEWTKTYYDMLDRPYKTLYADNSYSQSFYNNKGQLVKTVDPDVTTLYSYNARGELEVTAVDMEPDGNISSNDRVTSNVNDVVENDLGIIRRTWTYVYGEAGPVLSSIAEVSNSGLKSRITSFGLTNTVVTVYDRPNATRTVTATAPDGSQTVSTYQNGRLTSSASTAGALTLGGQSLSYDPHGRLAITTDNRTGTQTTNSYDNADEVLSTTVIPPGLPVQATSYQYDPMGRQTLVTLPDNGTVSSAYYSTGELATNSGARTYPVAYTYDYGGRVATMKTWKNYAANSGTATTSWSYDGQRGWLTAKTYANNTSVTYSNSAAGRLLSRTWARNVTTTYAYNNAGDLGTITYSEGTPSVAAVYDRRGRKINATDGAGTHVMTYNDAGQLLTESFPNSGVVVTNDYDSLLRRSKLSFKGSTITYGYDGASRLLVLTNGSKYVSYAYHANSSLVSNITFKTLLATKLKTIKLYDALNRLTTISNHVSAASIWPYTYTYNNANQRTRVDLADGSYWIYSYDSLGQVTSGKKYWSDGSEVAGQQFGYNFDDIGNRKSTTNNYRSATYLVLNAVNQYTSRTVPGYVSELGSAASNATVTINNQSVSRHGEYFSKELSVLNLSAAVYTQLVTVGVLKNAGLNSNDIVSSVTGKVFVAKSSEVFKYDGDGNLTNDGRFAYRWDGENRLVQVQTLTNLPTSVPQQKLLFGYDHQGRRISKLVSNWTGSAWTPGSTLKFVYDGWNLTAELDSTNGLVRSYMWGLDLSGTEQGAGGVGGLLCASTYSPQASTNYFAYDGNGNVVALVNAAGGVVAPSQYDYGPFGETLRATGPAATANPFGFSTRYQDDETSLVMFPKRPYNSSIGRWLSRDPVAEQGGQNLYAYVRNDGIDFVDPLGLKPHEITLITFIEAKSVQLLPGTAVFEGDNRTFGAGSFRTIHRLIVDPSALGNGLIAGSEYKDTGVTHELDPVTGAIKKTGKANTKSLTADVKRKDCCVVTAAMHGNAGNPLAGFGHAPGITYDVDIIVDERKGEITWSGDHDGFPAYDFYQDSAWVHRYSATAVGATAWRLFPPFPNIKVKGLKKIPATCK